MQRSFVNTRGNALVVTVMISLVMIISVMGITTSLTMGNRQTTTDQSLANRAQFAAESGMARGPQSIDPVLKYLAKQKIDLSSGISNQTQLTAARETLRDQMYKFCYGTQDGDDPAYSTFTITPTDVPDAGTLLCNSSAVDPVDGSASAETVGTTRMAIVSQRIAVADYAAAVANSPITTQAQANAYWGQLAQGKGGTPISLGTSGGLTERTTINLNLAPNNIRVFRNGSYQMLFGQPNEGIVAVGEVVNSSNQVIASRTITSATDDALISTTLEPPNFASFAWYYNTHRLSTNVTNTSSVVIRSTTRVDGPTFTNGRFVFENGANPTFVGSRGADFGSAGCEQGARLVNSAWVCDNQFTGYHTGDASDTNRFSTLDGQWNGFSNIGPRFEGKKDENGQYLCAGSTPNTEVVCSDQTAFNPSNATASYEANRIRNTNWKRSIIPLPTSGSLTNFQTRAQNGGLFINRTAATTTMTTQTESNRLNVTSLSALQSLNLSAVPFVNGTTNMTNMIGRSMAWDPEIKLQVVNGRQRIIVGSNVARGYTLAVRRVCNSTGGGGGGGGGGTAPPPPQQGVDAPGLKKFWTNLQPKLNEAGQLLSSVLTFGSSAYAQASVRSSSTNPNGGALDPAGCGTAGLARYEVYWTNDPGNNQRVSLKSDGTIDLNVIQNTNTSNMNNSGRWGAANVNTRSWVEWEYEVDNVDNISLVSSSNTWAQDSSNRTTDVWRSGGTGQNPVNPVTVNTSQPFNGVVYTNGGVQVNDMDRWTNDQTIRNRPEIASYSQLTIAALNDVRVASDLNYESNPINTTATTRPRNLLGIYAGDDVIIRPENRNSTTTRQNLQIDAVMMAQGRTDGSRGSIRLDDVCNTSGLNKGELRVTGSLIQNRLGGMNCRTYSSTSDTTGTFRGYTSNYTYDGRMLEGFAPPGFPTFDTGAWKTTVPSGANVVQRGFWRLKGQ